jgi:hypothetical protein
MKTAAQRILEAHKLAQQRAEATCEEFGILSQDGGPLHSVLNGLEQFLFKEALYAMEVEASREIQALKDQIKDLKYEMGNFDPMWDMERKLDNRDRARDMNRS